MVYNKADQLTNWPGMHSYTYLYPDGSLEAVTGANTASYTYTPAGLLNTATYSTPAGNHTLTNTWDADSNRVAMNANGQSYSFVNDVTAGIPAVVEDSSASGALYCISASRTAP